MESARTVDTLSYATDPAKHDERLLTKTDLEYFLSFVPKWGRAVALSLQGNRFESEACVGMLASAVVTSTPHLLSLNLSMTNLGDRGLVHFFKLAFQRNHKCSIKHLNVSAAGITNTGATELATLLTMRTTPLVNIDVRYNDLGFSGLAALIKHTAKLQRVDASFTNLDPEDEKGIVTMCKALRVNTNLHTLILKGNRLTSAVITRLKAAAALSKLNPRTFSPMSLHVLEATPGLDEHMTSLKNNTSPEIEFNESTLEDIASLEAPLIVVRNQRSSDEEAPSSQQKQEKEDEAVTKESNEPSPHRGSGEDADGDAVRPCGDKSKNEEAPPKPCDPVMVLERAPVGHSVPIPSARSEPRDVRSSSASSRRSAQERALFSWKLPSSKAKHEEDDDAHTRLSQAVTSPTRTQSRLVFARDTASVRSDVKSVKSEAGQSLSPSRAASTTRRSLSAGTTASTRRAPSEARSVTSSVRSAVSVASRRSSAAHSTTQGVSTASVEKGKILQKILNMCVADDTQCRQILDLPGLHVLRSGGDVPGLRVAMPEALRGFTAVPSELHKLPMKSDERVRGIAKLLWVVTYGGSTHIASSVLRGKLTVPRGKSQTEVAPYESGRNVENSMAIRLLQPLRPASATTRKVAPRTASAGSKPAVNSRITMSSRSSSTVAEDFSKKFPHLARVASLNGGGHEAGNRRSTAPRSASATTPARAPSRSSATSLQRPRSASTTDPKSPEPANPKKNGPSPPQRLVVKVRPA